MRDLTERIAGDCRATIVVLFHHPELTDRSRVGEIGVASVFDFDLDLGTKGE
jgi:hypothetical protein